MKAFMLPKPQISSGETAQKTILPRATYWGRWFTTVILLTWAASFVIGFQSALIVLTIIGFIAVVVGLRQPIIGLFGMSILCTLDPITKLLLLTGGLLRWNTYNYWLLIVMILYAPFLLRLNDLQTRLIQLFFLLMSLELVISPDRAVGADDVLGVVTLFGLLVYFARVGEDGNSWYWLGLINGILGAAGGLSYYLQRNHLPFVNPNNWAMFPQTALFAICMSLPFSTGRRRSQLLLMLLAVVNFAWVFLSGSRGNLLLAVICLIFLVITMQGFSGRVIFLIVTLLLGYIISTQFTDLQERTLQRVELLLNPGASLSHATSGRSDLLLGGWYIFLEHPFGVGTGGFGPIWASLGFREGITAFSYGYGINRPAHAGWLKILTENGIPGFLLFAMYVLSFVLVGWRSSDRKLLALGLLVTAILSSALISLELQWARGLWFLAAGVTVLFHRERMAAQIRAAARREPITNIIRHENLRHD